MKLHLICILTLAFTQLGQSADLLDAEEAAFLTLINQYRAQNGVGPLQISTTLESSSRWMSNDMAAKNYFSHTDSLGRSFGTRVAAFGYTFYPAGENIAAGYQDAPSVLVGWQTACDSDGTGCTYAHRKAMLDPSYVAIGIARAYNANSTYRWYWTTDFGGVVDQPTNPPPNSAPVITSYTASPSAIVDGQATVLSWFVTGATSLSIDGGVGVVTGATSVTVRPTVTTQYKLTASSTGGTVTASVMVTVAPSGDGQAPSAPASFTASAPSSSQVNLAWSASIDNVGVAGYQITRNGSMLVAVSSAALSYTDQTVAANTAYTYTIRAYDAAGNYSAAGTSAQVTTPAATTGGTCPGPATSAFTGCYYNNTTLTGNPSLVRTDQKIDFDWFYAAPAPSVTRDSFSTRWQGNFTFEAAEYIFTASISDGIRLYLDGFPLIDRWRDGAGFTYTARQTLAAGVHLLTVEYYTRTGWPSAHLTWVKNAPAGQAPTISSFAATPATIVAGQSTTLSWVVSGATSIGINSGIGDVSSTTSRMVSPSVTTTYLLTASNGTGSVSAQATVVVSTAVDSLPPSAPILISATAVHSARVDLTWGASSDNVGVAGYQILRNGSQAGTVPGTALTFSDTSVAPGTSYIYSIKAFDGAGNYSMPSGSAQVTTPAGSSQGACPAPANGAFTGCYYNNLTLTGTPALSRTDAQINFDWYYSAPAPGVSSSDFSVRWQGYFAFQAGSYTFTAMASDGMRLYVDGNLVLDRWRDQAASTYRVKLDLSQANHLIGLEYYDHAGLPTAHLAWQKN